MELKKKTEAALENANYYLDKIAFRKTESHPINMNLFETTLFLMMYLGRKDEYIKTILKDRLYHVINSYEFMSYIGNGRDAAINVKGRFRMIMAVAKEIENDR